MENDNCITITHFINPHLFWYKPIEAPGESKIHVVHAFEEVLLDLYKNKPSFDNVTRPQIGDRVAVNFVAWNKYIRAKILQKAEFHQEEFIVWALDYGFPLLTKKEYIRNLPNNLQADVDYIRLGGIVNVYPAEQEYDDMEGNLVMVKKDKWLQKTCNMLEKLLADANSVSFNKHYQTENEHTWGDLIVVNHKGVEINARNYLLNTTNAVEVDDNTFKKTCAKFKSTKIAPWLSNDRNNKMKFNNIKHNYIEHSNKMNANLIDENAKRKVEDWHERNERKTTEIAVGIAETTCELPEDSIDDITFDDSVSVAHNQQMNYIGKAGILTKIKQQKYSTDKDIPPSALPKYFEIGEMMVNLNLATEPQNKLPSCLGSACDSHAESKHQNESHSSISGSSCNNKRDIPLIDLESNSSLSKLSNAKLRQQKLYEMRLKVARAGKQLKTSKEICGQNESNSAVSLSKVSDTSYSYHILEQSSTLPRSNDTTVNNVQDNKSGSSIKNIRVQQLMAMRKKAASSSFPSSNDTSKVDIPKELKLEGKQNGDMDALNNLNFELKPITITKPNDQTKQLPQLYSVPPVSKKAIQDSLKLSQSGYDSLALVPAGYDITRLQNYKDEKNHWHRKKSTRKDYVPHDQTSSTEELLSSSTNDQSSSSADFTVTKPVKEPSQTSRNQFNVKSYLNNKTDSDNIARDSKLKTCAQKQDSRSSGNLTSELSASSKSSVLIQKSSKRRQLKSPTSQLSKIDKILLKHCIEKDLGNKNILDLQLLNTSANSQKSLLESTSSNMSCNNIIVSSVPQNDSIKNHSSRSSLSTDNIRKESVCKEALACEALVEVKRTETLPIIEGERKIQTKFIDHLVLAHSSIQLAPIEKISDAPFLPEIHEELCQMRVNKVLRIQVYSWTHVLRNNSLFVVNPSRSGKTWSYLPPLCSLLCCRIDAIKPSYGPVAVILVASLKHVEIVNNYCRRLMSSLKADAPSCIPSYGMRNLIETKVHLLNGCGILVATPSNILRILHENENEPLFDSERLQHIVIDDMDIMMSRSKQDFENAYRALFKTAKKSKYKKLLPQLIVTSRDWDCLFVKFIRKSNQPLLLIGDFLEAAVYGQATLSVKLKLNTEKNDAILKFLKNISACAEGMDNRTLIICNEDENVEYVHKFLQESGYPCLVFYSRSTENERVTVEEWKKQLSSQILICTDARFCELKIQNVNNLIHYSMPSSWTQFTSRFSALARTYNNNINHFEHSVLSTASAIKKNSAHSLILLDENNNMQLPRLVNFMRKHNQQVQDEIKAVSKRVLMTCEEQRILYTLCPQLLEFGECDEPRCDHRHELTRLDVIKKSDGIPSAGDIRIHVLKVFSPTFYAVRLLHHKPCNTNKWLECRRSSEALTFSVQLNMHYRNDNNLFLHWPPHINDLCIYQYAENFRRALILDAPTIEQKETNIVQSNLKVTLRLIDDGNVISSVKCNEIFVCDAKFKDFPAQAIDVRLMKVVPFDNERSWDSKTTKQVRKWIMDDIKSNYVVQASIDFSLAKTIWVRNVVVMEKLSGINAHCQVVNLKKSLIEKNFGVLYNGDRMHVRDLAEEFDLLNSYQSDDDANTAADSDMDYQSCKNESINLIKFSSSNEETTNSSIESAEISLEKVKSIDHKATRIEGTKPIKFANVEIGATTTIEEENWDEDVDSGKQYDEVYDPYQINNFNKNKLPKEETWYKLNLNELVKVEIGDEGENGNWENIFLQIIDNNSKILFDELNTLIVEHVEKLKSNKKNQENIYDFEPLHNCIVKYDNRYLRAKVHGIFGEKLDQRLYRFFLCDYACFTNASTKDLYNDFLYETNDEIITFTPYQAIHCTLAGIKWDRFNKRYQVTKDYLYACAVLECDSEQKSTSNLQNLPMHSYKILLYECEKENEFNDALLFNKALLNNCITLCDEETKAFLEYEIGIQENENHKSNNEVNHGSHDAVDVSQPNKEEVLTYQQLIDYIKSDKFDIEWNDILTDAEKLNAKKPNDNAIECKSNEDIVDSKERNCNIPLCNIKLLKENLKQPTSESDIEEQGHCTSCSNSSRKSSTSLNSTDVSVPELLVEHLPSLKAFYKRPQATWYQNDFMIFLSIYAPDINDYNLEVTPKTVLFAADIQNETSVLVLKLLGSIDAKSVSHEIKGVSVVIRLQKNVYIQWPRLLQQATKFSWLKYNFNAFDSIEMEYIMPQQYLHTLLDNELNFECRKTDNYNSDEDNERELYRTYNPIQTNDDDCDPFS